MEQSPNDFILRREHADQAIRITDIVHIRGDSYHNIIDVSIKANWGGITPKTLTNISLDKILILNLNHSTAYGHIYTEVLSELYAVHETFPGYGCVLTMTSPLINEIIQLFNLKLSNKIKFVERTEEFLLNFEELRVVNHSPQSYGNKVKNILALKSALSAKPVPKKDKEILLYCSRHSPEARHGRKITQENETQIIEVLNQYALEKNLEFYLLTGQEPDGTTTSISKQYELFSNAKLVVGAHGGVMSNLIFLDPLKAPAIIEFCPHIRWSFNDLFDGAILKFAEYHKILYQLPHNASILKAPESIKVLQKEESTINIAELKGVLSCIK